MNEATKAGMQASAPGSVRRAFAFLCAALMPLLASGTALAPASEQSLRAAMIFNFLKFTEFPPEMANDSLHLRLCLSVGDAAQAEALFALSGRKVMNRELVVVRLSERTDECHVVYVDSRQRWNAANEGRGVRGALTIGGYHGFVAEGGIIEIDLRSDGNRFYVNLAQARLARMRMSPQLLRLAHRLYE